MKTSPLEDEQLKLLWKEIGKKILGKKRSKIEALNLEAELAALSKRLDYDQFRYTNFLGHNTFAFPRRTNEFYFNIKRWVGQAKVWQRVFEVLLADEVNAIADLGVGYVPKIELALFRLGFAGRVHAFDFDEQAKGSVKAFMELFLDCPFELRMEGDFFIKNNVIVDLVVANHVIDDFLMDAYCKEKHRSLGDIYASEEAYMKTTKEIMGYSDDWVNTFIVSFVGRVDEILGLGGLLVMNSYLGILEEAMELSGWSSFCATISEKIKKQMLEMGYKQEKRLVEAVIKKGNEKFFNKHDLVGMRKV